MALGRSRVASSKLVTKNNRIGLCLGHRYDDLKHYAFLSPEADIRFGKVTLGLGVPLAIEIFDGHFDIEKDYTVAFDNAGSLRTEDWDEPGEYVRFIRYLKYGRKEDRLFFNLSQVASTTIGHGPLMRRYSVNIDPDSTRLSGQFDAYGDYAGFEFVTNSVVDWDIFGGIGFIKPLSFFSDNSIARSMSVGITYVADRHAPVALQTQTEPTINNMWVLGKGRPQVSSDAFLHGMGLDLEIKVVKTEHVDIKPFIDYSWFMPGTPSGEEFEPEGGGGLTIGVLGRFNFGEKLQAIRTIAELRYFSGTYLPGYFDTFYEVQRFIGNQRYQDYFNLDSLPPVEAGKRYVALAGGADALLEKADEAYEAGDYRWAAELLNHLVFAQADNAAGKALLANTYDQLGYQAESGPWRDVYLAAAYELRHGTADVMVDMATMTDVLKRTPVEKFFQSMSVRLDTEKADGVDMAVAINFTDLDKAYLLNVKNSVMHYRQTDTLATSNASLVLTRDLFVRMLTGDVGLRETLTSDDLNIEGSVLDLVRFFSLFGEQDGLFNIVTP